MDNRCAKNGAGTSHPVWSHIRQCGPAQPPRVFLNRRPGVRVSPGPPIPRKHAKNRAIPPTAPPRLIEPLLPMPTTQDGD